MAGKTSTFVLVILAVCFIWGFEDRLLADCQIGAFIADWSKNATFPWHGEQGIINYEGVIQRKVASVKIYKRINDEFPFAECLDIYNHGTETSPTLPYIDIHPSTNGDTAAPILLSIINGDFDAYIQNWASEAKDFGKPLWICFDGEVNGSWHNGSGAANGGSALAGYGDPAKPDGPEIFIDAWRHVHDIFTAAGATNVAWVWSVNNEDWPIEDWNRFENYYPGDNYVDWLGIDGYNWNRAEYGGWKTFQVLFDGALNRMGAITTQKPIMLSEFACAHKEIDKGNWIRDAFYCLKTNYPYVKSFTWFDMSKEENWLMDSDGSFSPSEALADAYFTSEGTTGTSALTPDKLINVALNKNVTASSAEAPDLEGQGAVDGVYITRWSSQGADPQWISVDLGLSYGIARVILNWEAAYAKSYKIQTSNDGVSWKDVYSTASGNGGVDDIPLAATARYIRMHGTQRGTPWGYSLFEFCVYVKEQKMHVYSIAMSTRARDSGSSASAKIKIVDTNGQPVSRALVSGHWSGLTNDIDSRTTDSNGLVQCNSDQTKSRSGTFTFTIDNVSKPGSIYDNSANVKTSDSISISYSR